LTWLVAASSEMLDRDIVRGVLGCPVCHAEYPITEGIADFRSGVTAGHGRHVARREHDVDSETLRLAALLDLSSPGGFVVLTGQWATCAATLSMRAERVHVLVMDPVDHAKVTSGDRISVALTAGQLPLQPGSARGIALDAPYAAPGQLAAAAEALRGLGRLVAPASALVPQGMRELARDARHWVAERDIAPGPLLSITLGRAEA
ncbi:MAG TPA: hypothetical protein VJ596_02010, partial [Gemmatimonadaceae bacterium]|nr:hypothetical protein [Gemmatimonadaceae bacterium]